jgi:multisubunit Na+/H+ antiporter MnhB subunit
VIFLSGGALCTATIFILLNAPDIAITKAAVEAGITTVIFIAVLQKTSRYEEKTGKDSGKKAALPPSNRKPPSGQGVKK